MSKWMRIPLVLAIVSICFISGIAMAREARFQALDDLNSADVRLGVAAGDASELVSQSRFPDVELVCLNSLANLSLALQAGRMPVKEGLTMLIVIHEISFAREVSSRIFYMDEGVIYESGRPTDIFDNPRRDKTCYFAKRCKVFERQIEGHGFDFPGFVTELKRFAGRQMMSPKKTTALQHLFEELCVEMLLGQRDVSLGVSVAYDERKDVCEVTTTYGGEAFDPLTANMQDDISLRMVRGITTELCYEYAGGENRLTARL